MTEATKQWVSAPGLRFVRRVFLFTVAVLSSRVADVRSVGLRHRLQLDVFGIDIGRILPSWHKKETPEDIQAKEERLRSALKNVNLSEDCRAAIEDCLETESSSHCHDDVLECVKTAVFGAEASLQYSDLGEDLDLAKTLKFVAKEVKMQDGDTVARRILSTCMTSEKSVWKVIFDRVASRVQPKTPNPAHDFMCGALLGEDLGTYVDTTVVPPQCDYAAAKASCKKRIAWPSLGTLYSKWYTKLLQVPNSAGSQGLTTFPDCWEKADRGECVAAVLLGRLCENTCQQSSCIVRELLATGRPECTRSLKASLNEFLDTSRGQCELLAKELRAPAPVLKCPAYSLPVEHGSEGNNKASGRNNKASFSSIAVVCILLLWSAW